MKKICDLAFVKLFILEDECVTMQAKFCVYIYIYILYICYISELLEDTCLSRRRWANNDGETPINFHSNWRRWQNMIRVYWKILNILQWRHNECDGVSNNQRIDCLLNRLFWHRWKKTSTLRVTGFCEGNPPVTGGFPSQKASNAGNVSIWWRHRELTTRHLSGIETTPRCLANVNA